jgi:hypothetical protein
MFQYKYIGEFSLILRIFQEEESQQEREIDKFVRKILSDEQIVGSLERFGLDKDIIEEVIKDMFEFLKDSDAIGLLDIIVDAVNSCPNSLPEEDCVDLQSQSYFFRLCREENINSIDFLPHPFEVERDRRKRFYKIEWIRRMNDTEVRNRICKFLGISIFETSDFFQTLFRLYPQLKRTYRYIAKLNINNESLGKVFFTPSKQNPHHYSWFPYFNVDEANTVVSIEPCNC